MATVQEHYDEHLARIYVWMAGGVEDAFRRGDEELAELDLQPLGNSRAVDLGAGFGMHAVPLARRGFTVVAADTSQVLLDELRRHADGLRIDVQFADALAAVEELDGEVELALCMGDTLTHLESIEKVGALLRACVGRLAPGGRFVTTFRDYTTSSPGSRQIVPVRSDDARILTCILAFEDEHVDVLDLIHERSGAGWELRVSGYRKLRLSPDWVADLLESAGCEVRRTTARSGMVCICAARD